LKEVFNTLYVIDIYTNIEHDYCQVLYRPTAAAMIRGESVFTSFARSSWRLECWIDCQHVFATVSVF